MLTAHAARVMSGIATCSRDPSGSDASTNGELRSTRRPVDCSIRSTRSRTSRLGELERDALGDAVARDEDAVGRVDPHLLDCRVVEERLQRAEPGERRDHLTRGRPLVGEHRQRAAERALAVAPHLVAHVAVGEVAIAGEVDPVAAHALAHLLGDEADRTGHADIVEGAPDAVPRLSTGVAAHRGSSRIREARHTERVLT